MLFNGCMLTHDLPLLHLIQLQNILSVLIFFFFFFLFSQLLFFLFCCLHCLSFFLLLLKCNFIAEGPAFRLHIQWISVLFLLNPPCPLNPCFDLRAISDHRELEKMWSFPAHLHHMYSRAVSCNAALKSFGMEHERGVRGKTLSNGEIEEEYMIRVCVRAWRPSSSLHTGSHSIHYWMILSCCGILCFCRCMYSRPRCERYEISSLRKILVKVSSS